MKREENERPQPAITIAIPLYNTREYIISCLESVARQTYRGEMECIIVDDCGTDGGLLLAEEFVGAYNGPIGFRIVHHERNRGLSAARNTGIKEARGEYIYFLDSDDTIFPECIALMAESLMRHPDAEIVFAGTEVTNDKYKWLDYTTKQLPDYSNDHDWLQRSMLRRFDFGMTSWNKLISRSFIAEHNLSFVEGMVHEDDVWNFDVSKNIRSAAFVKQNTYLYNTRENSIITGATEKKRWERLFALCDVLLSRVDEDKKELEIKAIFTCIILRTRTSFPKSQRKVLCKMFHKLGRQSQGKLAIQLYVLGLMALFIPAKYWNRFTRKSR